MQMQPVKSTQIESVGYDPANKILAVKFARGATYHYSNVAPEVHAEMLKAESIGKFFGAKIKGVYPFEKQAA